MQFKKITMAVSGDYAQVFHATAANFTEDAQKYVFTLYLPTERKDWFIRTPARVTIQKADAAVTVDNVTGAEVVY